MIFDSYRDNLLGRPSVTQGRMCAVCGRPATNLHHVVPKGIGGVSRETERRIPLVRLCGMGNASGCHGKAHAHTLHLQWADEKGGWCYLETKEPMPDWEAWRRYAKSFRPLPGWASQRSEGIVFGRKA